MFRVYLIVLALFAKPALTQIPATCSVDLSKEERMTRIRANIINQMGLSEAPKNPKVPVLVSDSQMEEFRMLESSLGVQSNKSCTDRETFARTKTTFIADRVDITEKTNSWKYDYDYAASGVEGNGFHGRKRDASTSHINKHEPTPIAYSATFKLDLENERLFNSAELVLWKTLVSPVSRVELTEFETVQVILVSHDYYYDTYYKTLMTKESREIIETKFLRTDLSEYVTFDVTHAVQTWLRTGKKSTGSIKFDIVVRPPDRVNSFKKLPPLIKFQIGQKNEASNETARLVISLIRRNELTDASSAGADGAIGQDSVERTKRQTTSVRLDADFCFKNPAEPNCCVRKLEIDFEKDFGWTWIVEPKKYSPNYCTGLCPFFWPTVSDSTRLLQQYKSLNPTSAVEPCCSPDNLKPLVLMFIIGDEPFLQLTQNMIVDNCICR